MSAAPYKINDRRGQEKNWIGSSNELFRGAKQTIDRRYTPPLDRDIHRNVSPFGRRTMMTLGRWLFANFDVVRGAIDELATFSVSSLIPKYKGANPAWGDMAEAWMAEHDKVCDIAGWPYNMATYRRLLIMSILRDGDMGTLLTQNQDGYPLIQAIPAHRIGCYQNETIVEGGEFDGARIIDGVIVNEYGRSVGYRVLGDNKDYRDISADDMFLSFIPESHGQLRGFSALGASVFGFKDVQEARELELIAQKLGASIGLIEKNEDGALDPAKEAMRRGLLTYQNPPGSCDSPIPQTRTETIDGVNVRYFKAGTGSGLEALRLDRPTANQQAFEDRIIRGALHGLGTSIDFSLDPSKISGAAIRLVVAKVNLQLQKLQQLVAIPAATRINGYRLGKVMDNPARPETDRLRLLPFDPDWYKFIFQTPAEITADAKYDSDVSIQEMRAGISSLQEEAAKRGRRWEEVQDEAIAVEKRLQERCKAEGVDPNRIVLLTPNGNPVNSNEAQSSQ